MKRSVCLYKHGTARRPSWQKDSYVYLSPEKKLYHSSTKSPYQPTLDDEMSADWEQYIAPKNPVWNEATGRAKGGEKLLQRDDVVKAFDRACRNHLVISGDSVADELGLRRA